MKRTFALAGLLTATLILPALADISTSYVKDVNYPDNAVVKPGQKIVKKWEVKVDSTSDVITNAHIKVVPIVWNKGKAGLDVLKSPIMVRDTIRGVKPNETFVVELPITVPKNLPDGLYEVDVKMCDKDGHIYNTTKKPLYALLQVKRK